MTSDLELLTQMGSFSFDLSECWNIKNHWKPPPHRVNPNPNPNVPSMTLKLRHPVRCNETLSLLYLDIILIQPC